MDPGPAGAEPFRATISTNGFNLGQLLTDSLGLGMISMDATINGTGLTPETMRAQAKANIREFDYNNYAYNNIALTGTINQNLYTVKATSNDDNLNFNLAGNFNLRNAQPAYTFDLDLGGANLKALNLYPEELGIQGQIKGNLTGADLSTLSGRVTMDDVLIRHNQETFPIDSMLLTLDQTAKGATITVASDALAANMQFSNDLATLPTALQKHFSNYFDLQPDPPYPANVNLGDFTFEINLKNTALIASFVPGLEQLTTTGPVTGSYDGQTQQLQMDGTFGVIDYTDYLLKDLSFQVRGNREQLNYTIGLNKLVSPSLQVENESLTGAARDNDMTVKLAIAADSTGKNRFVVGGLLNSIGRGYRFSFDPDQLVINYDKWTVPADNHLQFDANMLYAHNIVLSRGNSSVALNSTGPVRADAPLQVNFTNIDLGYIMKPFMEPDSLIAGVLDGQATLRNLLGGNTLSFTSDLTLSKFAYSGVPVGDIALRASTAGANRYSINAALTGNGNQMQITGFYEAQPNASLLNLDANIASLNLAALEGFTQGMVKDMGGNVGGRLHIAGTLADPNITGQLNFNQAQFNISMLNALYHVQNEKLVFNEQGISFPNFTITDSLNNDFTINGTIFTQNYVDYRFDLTATTDRFLAMNSTAADNELYYGTLLMAADATITGTLMEPEVSAKVKVLDGSAVTAVVPADEVGAAERDGIVEFVNLNDSLNAILRKGIEEPQATVGFVGADVDAEITVTDATPITIIIDPTTGDNLVVRGNGTLNTGITPSGQINLSGRYDITDGHYKMAFYDLVTRELDIAKDSYIAWTGDPMQAEMQITAIYRIKTAPMELVASELGGLGQSEQNTYRTELPFLVYVQVDGALLKPEIDFNIELPEQQRGAFNGQIEAKLANLRQNEAEMNKQVFALLVLGRFLAPDPLASSGGGLGATARNSLSQVMSEQLNNLTQRYAGGLGLELGVNSYEDYSSGSAAGRTDLNVALRQQFLNDRLTVRVGSDIGLEGKSAANNSMSGFGGDVSVEYSITKDGRLRVRGFRRNEYEGFIEGDVQATGVSLIYVRDYNNFSDLFRSLEKKEEKEKARLKEEAEGSK
jgi:hypothetical protein